MKILKNPNIRFIDDNADWEERKLGEINHPSIPTVYKNYYLEIGDIKPLSNLYILDKTKKVVSGAKLASGGTILISMVRPTRGAICKLKDENIFVSSGLYQFDSGNELLNNIILQQLQTYRFLKYCGDNSEGGTYPTISRNTIDEFKVVIPKNANKISSLLSNIDQKINAEETLIQKLKDAKSAMLSKMFPQENQSIPELRFIGFNNAWEQRKLGDIVTEVKRTDENSSAPVMMITANDGFINQSDRYSTNNAGQSLKKYILLEKGELAYNHGASKLRPYGSCFALTMEEKARIPFVYHCFSAERMNPEFLSIELNRFCILRLSTDHWFPFGVRTSYA